MASHALWLKNFVFILGLVDSISRPLKIYCDDSSTIFFTKNNRTTTTSKHIMIKFLVIREMVENENFLIEHILIEDMLVEPLTKGLRFIVFIKYVENIGVVKSFNIIG